jgi:hypothetical protein
MIVLLTLTTAGSETGPFDLYSDLDGFITPFETGVDKATLEAGYSTEVPDGASIVRITSAGDCVNSVDITLRLADCNLEGYVQAITTTTTTTGAPVITTVTEINIWFDNSGSMNSTLTPLQTMQNTLLKDCIGPIYGYDPLVPGSDALYNERVKVLNMGNVPNWNYNERFVQCLATSKNFNRTTDATVNQVLNLTFADESDDYGYGGQETFNPNVIAAQYATDIATLRSNFATSPFIKGIAFQVNTGPGAYPGFRALTQATFVDTGSYTPNANISDLTPFTYELDVVAGSTPEYYLTKVTSGLNTLGFTINCSTTTTTTTV